ncbi:MAG: hypothetical protein QNJ35_11430 [Paracoccaceae bacterium]|nr:hypothetical protein [Paracoccaceae bacterium]
MGVPVPLVFIAAFLLVVPFWRLLPKHGMSPYLSFLTIVPVFAILLLWIMAFKEQVEIDKK